MPAWVSSAVRAAPRDRTVMVRFGGTFFSAGWFGWAGKWFQLLPGGGRLEIADPPLWWDRDVPDQSIGEERRLVFGQETTSARPLRGHQQLGFKLDVSDSGMLSGGRGVAANPTGKAGMSIAPPSEAKARLQGCADLGALVVPDRG